MTSIEINKLDIERAMSFPMEDILVRYSSEHSIPPEIAIEHERELKRYLVMSVLNPNAKYSMAGPVDNLWHTFILFTQKYVKFCEQLAGHFIHHIPTSSSEEKVIIDHTIPSEFSSYEKFLKDYELFFQEPPPAHIWPKPLKDLEMDMAGCVCCHIDHSDSSWSLE